MPPTDGAKKGGLKITKALKSAARLPKRVVGVKNNGRGNNNFAPQPNEQPLVVLRLQILGCMQLLAKDRGGTSDPFIVASVLNNRQQTPVAKKTLNPTYTPKDATFDFPIYLSLADKLGVLELVVWDKDMLSKEYLGEVALPLEDWFLEKDGTPRPYAWNDPNNKPFSLDLLSTKSNTIATGSVQLKLGFVAPPNSNELMQWEAVYRELSKRSRPSLVSAPATEGVGTVRSNQAGPDLLEDDGGLSSSDSEGEDELDEDEDFVDALETEEPKDTLTPSRSNSQNRISTSPGPITTGLPPSASDISPPPYTPTSGAVTPTPTLPVKKTSGLIPRMKFPKRLSSKSVPSSSSSTSLVPTPTSETFPDEKKVKKAMTKQLKKKAFQFEGSNDIVGIVMLEIQSADDLPRLSNMTRTGWDMDPFVVISFGKKVFRTRVIRHSRNPVWDEKLLFHVRRYETTFKIQLSILDWDKLSANDHIGDASFDVSELVANAPQADPETGLYPANEESDHPMKEFKLSLETSEGESWKAKHNPTISLRAKYQPYDALRQRFWRQYLKQYDTDDTMTLSHLELTSMLDSLGSTLTSSTIASFFTRFSKDPHSGELTFEEAIHCLETELGRPRSEKKRIDQDGDGTSVGATPVLMASDGQGNPVKLEELDFSGPGRVDRHPEDSPDKIPAPENAGTQPMGEPVADVAAGQTADSSDASEDAEADEIEAVEDAVAATVGGVAVDAQERKKKKLRFRKKKEAKKVSSGSPGSQGDSESSGEKSNGEAVDSVERVINVKSCPLCHRPRMNSKAEMDIITHLAVCASQDWNAVDKIVVGNFVTASQAQRKWYTKVLGKVSSGDYKLGANSANIIVQNRMTGTLEEEKMQVYVRLGIRLLYKGATSQMEGGRARRLLKSLSIKQGVKYDDPASAAEIPAFIVFHRLKVDEILDPLDSFKTFNQFFYRKLKPSARPVEAPEDPYRLVSAADCRLMTFETVSEATRIWIKGRDFSVGRLLGENYKADWDRYNGGALAIFRLAPQDYHRFHSPVDGTIGKMTYISGEYYTVNPQAIRTALDVYGENARKIVPIDSPQFGRVMAVCVGAMMVGSIETTVDEGQTLKKGDEFGYFAFGGSTIVVLFEKGTVEWDEDLLINGRASLETLVRVGMGLGRGFPKA
ncbi:phosphatidylserine decarboxylase-domain-containing protein [Ephemerocybe angulata]|uniref:Phosphatidylserine decarboxylase proenzyme 2 n=1 Tax=Ephemerocybe angulata TaxID=980116 RepID=A0A8H6MHM1_9AGAR|nr:phosphatidylserine decarboxylase-domain-containing protein [Tulosesus angulatus]